MTKEVLSPNEKLKLMKSWALKSGYPLENDVAKVLSSFGSQAKISRNVTFHAKDMDGEPAIRSIDFKCAFDFPTVTIPGWRRGVDEKASLTFLIDAKYSEDETFWFTPISTPVEPLVFPHLIPMMTKDSWGRSDLKIHRLEFVKVAQVETGGGVASSGKKVKEQTKERNSLADYQIQMIGALQAIIQEEAASLGQPSEDDSSYSRDIHIYVPIIATNAPLHFLKRDIITTAVEAARTEDDISSPMDRVVVTQPHFFHVKAALLELSKTITNIRPRHDTPLAWLPQDLTAFPIIFVNVASLCSVIGSVVKVFEAATNKTTPNR